VFSLKLYEERLLDPTRIPISPGGGGHRVILITKVWLSPHRLPASALPAVSSTVRERLLAKQKTDMPPSALRAHKLSSQLNVLVYHVDKGCEGTTDRDYVVVYELT